ncbi:hypothetical protein D9758_014885 [Tetrapyrgos nigripes]|uniref:Uncharacterized protein n=1 Tax=Tetrapyrgos nigripes TaxID=182062 RepID=A0A8H5CDB8_9AGAR|nr:hypothetical protein D9758_014885 [Tetrapyrgos nigripes]
MSSNLHPNPNSSSDDGFPKDSSDSSPPTSGERYRYRDTNNLGITSVNSVETFYADMNPNLDGRASTCWTSQAPVTTTAQEPNHPALHTYPPRSRYQDATLTSVNSSERFDAHINVNADEDSSGSDQNALYSYPPVPRFGQSWASQSSPDQSSYDTYVRSHLVPYFQDQITPSLSDIRDKVEGRVAAWRGSRILRRKGLITTLGAGDWRSVDGVDVDVETEYYDSEDEDFLVVSRARRPDTAPELDVPSRFWEDISSD